MKNILNFAKDKKPIVIPSTSEGDRGHTTKDDTSTTVKK